MKNCPLVVIFILITVLISSSCSGAPATVLHSPAPVISTPLPPTTTALLPPTATVLPPTATAPLPTPTQVLPTFTPTTVPPTPTVPPKGVNYLNPQKYDVTYLVNITNNGFNPTDLRVYLPLPVEWKAQKDVKIVEVSPAPQAQGVEATTGNSMAFWREIGSPVQGKTLTLTANFTLTAYETKTTIDPAEVKPYQTGSADYKRYTRAEQYIESTDPEIVKLANTIAGEETNPYLLASKFYDYVIDHTGYLLLGNGLNGAKYVVDHHNGECGDYSALFIALARAKGIPARPVVGYWAISGKEQTHVWAEFYLEGGAWIPVDATIGQQSPEKRKYYFGNMDNQRVILSKGYNDPLTPPGPDNYIAPLLQAPFWWYWGDGDGNKMAMDRQWKVKKLD